MRRPGDAPATLGDAPNDGAAPPSPSPAPHPPGGDDDVEPAVMETLDDGAWYAVAARRAHLPQLTWRSVGTGALLGFFLSFTNLYLGLLTGWVIGVGLTSSILSFTIWSALHRAGIVKRPMTLLESNCMQSTAAAAGYSTGEPLLRGIPALLLLSVTEASPGGTKLPWLLMAAWVSCLAALGVTLAVPLKRSFIHEERLPFPSGTAVATMLYGFHSRGEDAAPRARALFGAGAIAAAVGLLREVRIVPSLDAAGRATRRALLPASSPLFDVLPRVHVGARAYRLSDLGIKLDHGLVLVGAGALVGLRVTVSMLAGGLVLAFAIAPAALAWTWRSPGGAAVAATASLATAWRDIGVWFGAPLLAASALTTIAYRWRSFASALAALVPRRRAALDPRAARLEVPASWFAAGTILSGGAIVLLAWRSFGVPPAYGALAVALGSLFAIVSCRTVGETDLSASSAMGKLTQLTYGVLIPQSATASVVTASITSGASIAASELLTDLKAGHLLGARPRSQFLAQLAGSFTGTIASCLAYTLLVPDARVFAGEGGEEPRFAAPSAQQWKVLALVLRDGVESLHPLARIGLAAGLAAGVALAVAEASFPRARRFLPSPTGLGLGLLLPFPSVLSMLLGAALAKAWEARAKGNAGAFLLPVASGLIAGESLIGVVVAGLNNFVFSR